jgi:hypothetical protein
LVSLSLLTFAFACGRTTNVDEDGIGSAAQSGTSTFGCRLSELAAEGFEHLGYVHSRASKRSNWA